jgi:DNA-directed RNA polymerase specialized sigma24 family protein
LPAQQRRVIVLRYFEDLTEADTAEHLGISVGAVKSATSRGLARPRAQYTPTGEEQ